LTTVSKAIANGYPISAVVGKKEVMLEASKTRLSSTFLVNSFSMIAALETLRELREKNGIQYMWALGEKLMRGLNEILEEEGVDAKVTGAPPLPFLVFTEEALKKAFYIESTARGVLFHPNHCWFLSMGHTDRDVEKTLEVSRESLRIAKKGI